ncbi:acetyl-CoA carboxylase biotin carboxyl carrier protein subunit [Enterococcus cecorum]|uniref:acetyl-CoA carboxylase biotin carboxyl carrier protein subunit n=1 Tax=Enterococcus cecorum TaxID=44008 RepID=UPI003F9308FA
MLRKFKISIDGKEYLVEMEEIGGGAPQAPVVPQAPVTPTPPVAPQAPVAPEVPKTPTAASPVTSDAEPLVAPMPGNILKLLVNVGDSVQENQPVMILEAMKMENEIVAHRSGFVKQICVEVNTMVNPGDPLIVIE